MMIETGSQSIFLSNMKIGRIRGACTLTPTPGKTGKQYENEFSEAYLSQIPAINYTGLLPQQIQ